MLTDCSLIGKFPLFFPCLPGLPPQSWKFSAHLNHGLLHKSRILLNAAREAILRSVM